MTRIPLVAAAALLTLLARTAVAGGTYSESFSTTTYKDPVNTTADWNASAGELRLFDLPHVIGTEATPTSAAGVCVWGEYAYVADGLAGVRIIDISDPTSPTLAATFDTPGYARAVWADGNHVYVADDSTGLQIFDITDPTLPSFTGSYDTPGAARDVQVAGDHAYVADDSAGLQVININNPASPVLAADFDTPGALSGLHLSGDYCYATNGVGLGSIDISDPTSPVLGGTVLTPSNALDVFVSGDYAYVADDASGLQVVDVTIPDTLVIVGSYDTAGNALGIVVDGDRAYIADGGNGLVSVDISDPTLPALAGEADTPGTASGLFHSGENAYVGDLTGGLQVIAVKSLTLPTLAGSYSTGLTSNGLHGLDIAGDYALVTAGPQGIRVFDISDPTNPMLVGTGTSNQDTRAILAVGNYGYTAEKGFYSVRDLSDPTNPTTLVIDVPGGSAENIFVDGDVAYMPNKSVVYRYDISDPTTIVFLNSILAGTNEIDVEVADNIAYVLYDSGIYFMTTSTFPSAVGLYSSITLGSAIDVEGDNAFVADFTDGLVVIDVSAFGAASQIGQLSWPAAADVVVQGDHAFVTSYNGLAIVDISDPTAPVLAQSYSTSARRVEVAGNYAYVTTTTGDLEVLQAYQSLFAEGTARYGQSLPIDGGDDVIVRASLATTQSDTIDWELSTDAGTTWDAIAPDGMWHEVTAGNDLVWRSTHSVVGSGNPTASQLDIAWLFDAASIDSVVDVAGDQGGWASLYFTRSGYDFADATYPIAAYNVHRRVDSPALIAQILAEGDPVAASTAEGAAHDGGERYVPAVGKTLRLRESHYWMRDEMAAGPPPGMWQVVATAYAQQADQYNVLVPTVVDSMETVYYISAHSTTPSIFFASHPDSGFSVDNIAPAVPLNVIAAYNTGSGNQLAWDPSPENDFQYYRIYRDSDPNFVPGPGNFVHATVSPSWTDPDYDGGMVYYKVTALDYAGNESGPGTPTNVTGVRDLTPDRFALHAAVPNPFNPSTMIRYDVPASGGHVTITVYDVTGRRVTTLVDRQHTAGAYETTWDGRNRTGQSVASGVYFYEMRTQTFTRTRKMVLLE